jgi:hypothetical protein
MDPSGHCRLCLGAGWVSRSLGLPGVGHEMADLGAAGRVEERLARLWAVGGVQDGAEP